MTQERSKIVIEVGGSNVIDELRPLWLSLHRHHRTVEPNLAPYVDDQTSWRMRRRYYDECLAHPESFVRVARRAKTAVGYALVRVEPTTTMWGDRWVTGDRTAEFVTLVVSREERGRGIGTALLGVWRRRSKGWGSATLSSEQFRTTPKHWNCIVNEASNRLG